MDIFLKIKKRVASWFDERNIWFYYLSCLLLCLYTSRTRIYPLHLNARGVPCSGSKMAAKRQWGVYALLFPVPLEEEGVFIDRGVAGGKAECRSGGMNERAFLNCCHSDHVPQS